MQIPEYYPNWVKTLSDKDLSTEEANLTGLLSLVNQKLDIIYQLKVIKQITEEPKKIKSKKHG